MSDTFKFSIEVPKQVVLPDSIDPIERQGFFDWLWGQFLDHGMVGIHEGTLLSEDAADQGLETDSWTVDSALAPKERDWVGSQQDSQAEVYFSSQEAAEQALIILKGIENLRLGPLERQEDQDWDANWKASFLNN